jgi:hypothetical protein
VIAPEDYCRELEAYLCRKNDGHLIRIVGPAFEQVSQWARDGIPLTVACSGVDRYFERYYRKGPRRRPVRIESCEADVRDAFDGWRRAVGVARLPDANGAAEQERAHRSTLAAHVERTVSRLTACRGSTQAPSALGAVLDDIVRQLDRMAPDARRARGEARAALTAELAALDRHLVEAAVNALPAAERERLSHEAARELEPFRARMLPETFARTHASAFERLVRRHFGLPALGYE